MKKPGFAPAYMSAPPTSTIMAPLATWTRRPQTRRGMASAGPDAAPRNDKRKISRPMVAAKMRNADSPKKKPPTPAAKTATAARNGPVQPTPTRTKPLPKR